jgi:eukaryotic-like serine/threonine-protein kinase
MTGFRAGRLTTSGIGEEKLVYSSELGDNVTSWSSDGRFLLFNTAGERTGSGAEQDLWSFSFSEKKASLLFKTPFREHDAQMSPDGRWIAYAADDTGRPEIYVQSFPPSGVRWPISTAGGLRPKWRDDGRELVYLATEIPKFMSVEVRTDASLEAGAPQALFDATMLRNQYSFDITADGQRFLVVTFAQRDGGTPITLIQNWQELLRK